MNVRLLAAAVNHYCRWMMKAGEPISGDLEHLRQVVNALSGDGHKEDVSLTDKATIEGEQIPADRNQHGPWSGVREVATSLDISERTVRRYLNSGKLKRIIVKGNNSET